MTTSININGLTLGDNAPLLFIGGPCVIESEELALRTASEMQTICEKLKVPFIYKSSYDKGNRSSRDSFRGVGIDEGLKILQKVKELTGLAVLSDVHSVAEINSAENVLDVLQIPAFLCRQTDLLLAAGTTGKVVNIKKGQFMAPYDMGNAVEKVQSAGGVNSPVALTERGTTFGYNNLVVDIPGLREMAQFAPVIFDAGHSAQSPGGLGNVSGGKREKIPILARAAVAARVAGLFLEIHPDPDNAPCDGPNMWPLNRLADLLATLKRIDEIAKEL